MDNTPSTPEAQPVFWLQRPRVRWALVLGFWTLVGIFYVGRYCILNYLDGKPIESNWIIMTFVGWWMWVLQTPIIWYLARKYPLDRPERKWRNISLHVLSALVILSLPVIPYSLLFSVLSPSVEFDTTFANTFQRVLVGTLPFDLLIYLSVVGIAHAYEYYRKFRQRALRATQLETQLAKAQVQALKMQLHPHFLFNTLHAISALMDEDVKSSRDMLILLSELLRMTLDRADQQEVTLAQEMAFVQRYLDIQQIRFQGQLNIEIDIEPDVQHALVPNLLLQPLVENAIQHGAAPEGTVSEVTIRAFQEEGILRLQVADNGPGLLGMGDGAPVSTSGIGLKNTRERLHQIYGRTHRLEFDEAPGGGALVTVVLPFHTEADAVEVIG